MSECSPSTQPRNRGRDTSYYTDSWHLSLFLPHSMELIAKGDGSHNLPVMWPFLHGSWIVSTDVSSMTWCGHEPENCPITAETLDRPLCSVRKTFATLYQQWLSIPAKAWSEPAIEPKRDGSNYVFGDQLFDALLVDRFRGLRTLFALDKTKDQDGDVPALFVRWGHSGGGVILPRVDGQAPVE